MLFTAPHLRPPRGVAITHPCLTRGPRNRDTDRRFPTAPAAAWQIVACVLLLWLGSQAAALGRTWTSRDGRYTIQANFVKLEGDAVTLQAADNQFRTVRLDQLSDADQDLAHQLARTLAHSVQAETVGIGLSPDDALNDAFAKAIFQAVGAEVSAKTVVESDELVQDRVLVFSDGFVRDYKDFGCRQEAGLFYRKILAYVQRRDLRSDAVDSEEDGNARRLYAEAYTKVRRHRIGMLLLQEALDSFNANMLDAKLADLGKPEVLPKDLDRVRITCRLTVQVRPDWYDQVRQKLENVLAAIARSQGRVEVVHRRFPAGHEKQRETILQLQQRFWARGEATAANFGDVYTLMNAKTLERLPDVATANAREQGSALFFIYSPPGAEDAASTGIKSRWRWFEIDDQPRMPTQGIDVVVRYTNQAGNAVLAERFPLGPEVPGLSANDTNAKLRTTVVSPFFLYHWSDGYEIKDFPHAHRVTLERKIIVPLTTLARVQTAKSLAVDENVERTADFPLNLQTPPETSKFSGGPPRTVAPFDENAAKQHQAAWAEYLRTPVEHTSSIGMQLALIPPGEFLMGSPQTEEGRRDDEFLHRVRITMPFYLGMHEVTQGEYERVMTLRANPSSFSKRGRYRNGLAGWDTSRFPVENVSWETAQEFCANLSARSEEQSTGWTYRLPTEAEWEYACRAGTTTPFNCGSELTGRQANINGNAPYGTEAKGPYLERTTTVGSFAANAFGLYDMHGNVLEWCQDWYADAYYKSSPLEDPPGPSTGPLRVIRDGGWGTGAKDCRAARRCWHEPQFRGDGGLGFRVVAVPVPGWTKGPIQVKPNKGITQTQNGPVGTFQSSTADLVNRGQPSLGSIAIVGGQAIGDSSVKALNDGELYDRWGAVDIRATLHPSDGTAVLFTLNTADAFRGYDVAAIVSTTGSGGPGQARSRQNYTLEVAGVGSTRFVPVVTVDNLGSRVDEVQVTTIGDNNQPLASGVDRIRVTFHNTDCECRESMYREFDIIGTPTRN